MLVVVATFFGSCNGQQPSNDFKPTREDIAVGGPFENRNLIYSEMPKTIKSVDTSPGWKQDTQKLLITGKILKKDGKTPAPNVVLYYYHTDISGVYPTPDSLPKNLRPHGAIRGWVQSDAEGNYAIYTSMPGAYPNRNTPAHIHPSIKEPGIQHYWLDEFIFDNDPLVTTEYRAAMRNRGGSGVLRTVKRDGMLIAEHNIILGLNIPGYP